LLLFRISVYVFSFCFCFCFLSCHSFSLLLSYLISLSLFILSNSFKFLMPSLLFLFYFFLFYPSHYCVVSFCLSVFTCHFVFSLSCFPFKNHVLYSVTPLSIYVSFLLIL
jgi:hypothetical protein